MSLVRFYLLVISFFFAMAAFAMVNDIYEFQTPAQTAQFSRLTQAFRCLVCQNESLADSGAPLAQDLRAEVAQLVKENKSDETIKNYLVSRYGKFVLFKPPLITSTYVLWFMPFILLLLGLSLLLVFVLKRPGKKS